MQQDSEQNLVSIDKPVDSQSKIARALGWTSFLMNYIKKTELYDAELTKLVYFKD